MKIVAEVTKQELDSLECLCTCIPLCDKHVQVVKINERPKGCKACAKVYREWWGRSFHLWSKLMTGYLAAEKKGKRERR